MPRVLFVEPNNSKEVLACRVRTRVEGIPGSSLMVANGELHSLLPSMMPGEVSDQRDRGGIASRMSEVRERSKKSVTVDA